MLPSSTLPDHKAVKPTCCVPVCALSGALESRCWISTAKRAPSTKGRKNIGGETHSIPITYWF